MLFRYRILLTSFRVSICVSSTIGEAGDDVDLVQANVRPRHVIDPLMLVDCSPARQKKGDCNPPKNWEEWGKKRQQHWDDFNDTVIAGRKQGEEDYKAKWAEHKEQYNKNWSVKAKWIKTDRRRKYPAGAWLRPGVDPRVYDDDEMAPAPAPDDEPVEPTLEPTQEPTLKPTLKPSLKPTPKPTPKPPAPTARPTQKPTTPKPTPKPTKAKAPFGVYKENTRCVKQRWTGKKGITPQQCMAIIKAMPKCNQDFFNHATERDKNCGCITKDSDCTDSKVSHKKQTGIHIYSTR
jgi:hypothetical protein